jgi:hypothetical protein
MWDVDVSFFLFFCFSPSVRPANAVLNYVLHSSYVGSKDIMQSRYSRLLERGKKLLRQISLNLLFFSTGALQKIIAPPYQYLVSVVR